MRPVVHAVADEALGNTAYLVETGDGRAVSVDPRRDAGEHLALAEGLGLRITDVLETHLHADFIGGAREVAAATGARVVAAADAGLRTSHVGVAPGDRIEVGGAPVEVIATPGHTPEHLAYLLDGAVFTGGSLIVGGVARTDLTGAERTEELARAQFASIRRLVALPGATRVYPTHGAGSFCSTGARRGDPGTLADRIAADPLLAIDDEAAFVRLLVGSYGSYPRYFAHLREVNREGAPPIASLLDVAEIAPSQAHALARDGAYLIDLRPVDEVAAGYPDGAVSIALRDSFASWLGWVVPFGAPVVLIGDAAKAAEATVLARRIGYDGIAGWTTLGAWRDAGLPVAAFDDVDPAEAARRRDGGAVLLDVRQVTELRASRIAGAQHLELGDVIAGKGAEAPEVITFCAHGERAATAATLLAARGVRVANLRGGIDGWRRAGLPVER